MKKMINEVVELVVAISNTEKDLYGKTIYQIANSKDESDLTKMTKKLYNRFIKVKDDLDISVFVLINRLITQMDIAALPYVVAGNDLYHEYFKKLITKCYNLDPSDYEIFIGNVRSEILKQITSNQYKSVELKYSSGNRGVSIIDTDNILLTIMTSNNYKNHPVRQFIQKAMESDKPIIRVITATNQNVTTPDGYVDKIRIVNGEIKVDLIARFDSMSRNLFLLMRNRNSELFKENPHLKDNWVLKPVFKTKLPESGIKPENAIDNIIGLIGFNLTKSKDFVDVDPNYVHKIDSSYFFDYSEKLETIYANGFINLEFRSSRSGKKTTEPVIPNDGISIFEIRDSYKILDYLATNSSLEKSHPVRSTVNGINTGTINPVLVLREPPEKTNNVLNCISASNLEGFITKIFLTEKGFKAEVSMCRDSVLKSSQNNKNVNPVLVPIYQSSVSLTDDIDENSIKTVKSLVGFYIVDKSEIEGK